MYRFLERVLPAGFDEVRFCGLLAPGNRGRLRQIGEFLLSTSSNPNQSTSATPDRQPSQRDARSSTCPPMSGRFPRSGPLCAIPQEGAPVNRAHSAGLSGRPPSGCASCRAQPYTYAFAAPRTTPRPFLLPPTDSSLSLPPRKEAVSSCLIYPGKSPIVAPQAPIRR
jgi:hypothetical protein